MMFRMDTQQIAERLKQASTARRLNRMPRGMLDKLAPEIYNSVKGGMSLHDVRRHFEHTEGYLVTVKAISDALKRNNFVSSDKPNPNSHNVCYI